MNTTTIGATQSSTRPTEKTATAPGSSVLSLDPWKCHPSPGNRTPTMELVAQRLCEHRRHWPASSGHCPRSSHYRRRVRDSCRPPDASAAESSTSRSKRKRLSVMSPRPPSSSCAYRETRCAKRCRSSSWPMISSLPATRRLHTGRPRRQGASVQGADLTGAAQASKNLAPELRPLVDDFTIRPSVAFQIATLPSHDLQRQVADKVIQSDLKRDAVAALVARLKGKKPKNSAGQGQDTRWSELVLSRSLRGDACRGREIDQGA